MDYWDKLKGLFSPDEQEQKTEKIVFTPEELKEMNDPETVVGRLLNPDQQGEDDPRQLSYDGPRQLFYKKGQKETVGPTADAYIKDAEKRGIVHPDEDRITKNYKIIEDIKKTKNLEDIPITFNPLHTKWGEYNRKNKSIDLNEKIAPFYAIDPQRQRLKQDAPDLFSLLAGVAQDNPFSNEEIYEKIPLSEQKDKQKLINDRHLTTSIHELRHAEDDKNYPELAKKGFYGHFKDGRRALWENEHDAGAIHDITAAALKRLSNMGKKKDE